jgi:hypothetical protein
MKFLYGICLYYRYYNFENIRNHINIFKNLKIEYNHEFKFIINVMIDSLDIKERQIIIDKIKADIKSIYIDDIYITHEFNIIY